MFFVSLMISMIGIGTGALMLGQGETILGGVLLGGSVLYLFLTVLYYSNKKNKKSKLDWLNCGDCGDLDCDGPDCDCST